MRAAKAGVTAQSLAAAIWSLQASGGIGLELRKGKALGFIPKTDLSVTLTRVGTTSAGIEGELLATLARKSPRSVESLIGDWYGKKAAVSPDHVVHGRIKQHAEAAGLLDRRTEDAGRGAVTGFLLGKSKEVVAVDPTAVAASAAAIEQVASGWAAFESASPELARHLVERIEKAIAGKEMSDSDSGGGDFD
jgi:hypothetical protein